MGTRTLNTQRSFASSVSSSAPNILESEPRKDDHEISSKEEEDLASPEPPENEDTIQIRLRLPNGEILKRKFRTFDNLKKIYEYINKKSFTRDSIEKTHFILSSNFPRRVYEELDVTIETSGLCDISTKREDGLMVSPTIYVEISSPSPHASPSPSRGDRTKASKYESVGDGGSKGSDSLHSNDEKKE